MSRLEKQAAFALAVLAAQGLTTGLLWVLWGRPLSSVVVGSTWMAALAFTPLVGRRGGPAAAGAGKRRLTEVVPGLVLATGIWLYLEYHMRTGLPSALYVAIVAFLLWSRRGGRGGLAWPAYDERERELIGRSLRAAGRVTWIVFVSGSMLVFSAFAGRSVPAEAFVVQIVGLHWLLAAVCAIVLVWGERSWRT